MGRRGLLHAAASGRRGSPTVGLRERRIGDRGRRRLRERHLHDHRVAPQRNYDGGLDGSATAGADYTTASGQATLSRSRRAVNVTISVLGDLLDEPNETFFLNLLNPVGGTISDSQGIGTILDNDPTPSLSVDDQTVAESIGTATFTMSLSAASGQTVTVDYATSDGTATSPADYTGQSGPSRSPPA